MKTFLVTGCAGFIGSTLVDRLLFDGCIVIGIDNLSTGRQNFLSSALDNDRFTFLEMDLLESRRLSHIFSDVDCVFHLSANADVRYGTINPRKDLEQNIMVTHNVLEAMRTQKVKHLIFASSGSVYGESRVIPTPEDAPFPVQTSLYGASKAACEGIISAYAEGFGLRATILRFVSVLGERYTHGHVYDFYRQLKEDPSRLMVLGDGNQRKSYLYVGDVIEAMMCASHHCFKASKGHLSIFNVGAEDYCCVSDSVQWITEELGLSPSIMYSGGDRGWVGDNPFILLDTTRLRALGWQPQRTIREGFTRTVDFLKANEWVFEKAREVSCLSQGKKG
jgi:UDP-glucose 4-epimerase